MSNTEYREHRILRISFWIKLAFILIEVVLAIAFGATNFKHSYNAAAVLEWAIAFIFTFYVFSFFIDLIPAVHSKHSGRKSWGDETEMQVEANDGRDGPDNRLANGYDSQRTVGGNDVQAVRGDKQHTEGTPIASNF